MSQQSHLLGISLKRRKRFIAPAANSLPLFLSTKEVTSPRLLISARTSEFSITKPFLVSVSVTLFLGFLAFSAGTSEIAPQLGSVTNAFRPSAVFSTGTYFPSAVSAPFSKPSGRVTSVFLSKPRELNTVTALALALPSISLVCAVLRSAPASEMTLLCNFSASTYTLAMEEPGRISWNWLRSTSFQRASASAFGYSPPASAAGTAQNSSSRSASSLFLLPFLTDA